MSKDPGLEGREMLEFLFQEIDHYRVFDEARRKADELGKPLLNAGCEGLPYISLAHPSSFLSRARIYSIRKSDVNLDIVPRPGVPNFVLGNIEDLSMFYDKQFGAVFASHILEHVNDLEKAQSELARVADYQFIMTPPAVALGAWLTPEHRRVFADSRGQKVLLDLPPKPWD
jgi:hypothetical protein